MTMDFTGRVVLVTGAAEGLGRAYALWLAERGARIVANNRVHSGRPGGAADLVAEIAAMGGEAVAEDSDIGDARAGEAMVAKALDTYGRIDAVIANAAANRAIALDDVTLGDVRQNMDLNFFGAVAPVWAALPHMRRAGYGRIVMSTSTAALFAQRGHLGYASSKMATVGFARALAFELGRENVRVNVISPLARTEMSKNVLTGSVGELAGPEKVAPVVGWLASEGCDVTGQIVFAGAGRLRRDTVVEGPVAEIGDDAGAAFRSVRELTTVYEPRHSGHAGLALVPELAELAR